MSEYVDRPCMACVVGLFHECENPKEIEGTDFIIPCATWLFRIDVETVNRREERERNPVGRPLSDPSDITDATSTGRKRAASLHPILDGMRCEWAGLKHAGGGVQPIVGCRDHTLLAVKGEHVGTQWQGDLHHGPDKNTLHNTPGVNLHAICNQCHKRWHELNNPFYEKPRPPAAQPWLPAEDYWNHDPITGFTPEEHELAELWWALPVEDRPAYPFSPPTTSKKNLTTPSNLSTLPHNPFIQEGQSI